ncbi:Gamma-glutamyltranspeptidase 2 [Hibiscus syriacus]|uniref:Gamma-glutamyltranspeptidase 2 n=1 Tax=Hibiscus syriacus TaxID=106335 RepID=A0A6A3AV23_HIBSY|nr:Gamma-glutamyltranspeptidase 2 [Hibiscus syriacus]
MTKTSTATATATYSTPCKKYPSMVLFVWLGRGEREENLFFHPIRDASKSLHIAGRCSTIGANVLRIGGHAVDLAVAISLCLGVVSPGSSGIGGGSFMLEANGKTQVFDMRETAPMKASENMYAGNASLKVRGGLSIAVPGPGQLAGLQKAWKHHGRLPWERPVKLAGTLARKGFEISRISECKWKVRNYRSWQIRGFVPFSHQMGSFWKLVTCYNKKLVETLRKISVYGAQIFYNGSIGFNLARDVQKGGGILTLTDLNKYEILNILAQYAIPTGLSASLGTHRLIEALKHAFAVRMNLGDPEFVDVTEVVADMLSPEFAKELKETICDGPNHYGGRWNQISDHGTIHVSIVDTNHNAVSITNTVNGFFGQKILSPSTGMVLNNEMDDFSMPSNDTSENTPPPAPSNFIRPGKRLLSTMTPTIILKDGKPKAVVGASGGANIIAGTTQVLLNHFALGMDPLSSVMAPRVYHQLVTLEKEGCRPVFDTPWEMPFSYSLEYDS